MSAATADVERPNRLGGVRPRDVVCVIDHLGRDMDLASDARDGWFTHAGVRLHLGAEPDWLHDGLADDEEWRIEWVKLYEGLDLAHAYAVTGDHTYRTTWERLVVGFCAAVPVGHDSSDVSARRIQNWVYAWQRFAAAGPGAGGGASDGGGDDAITAPTAAVVLERLRADVEHLRSHLTAERNHRTLELYALLVVALAFPHHLDPDATLARFAIDELHTNALTDIWSDGVHRECSTDYHHIVLRSLLGTIANARRFDLALRPEFVERVAAACDFAMHVQRPDGTIPSFSDGDNGDFRDVLTLGASLFDRDDLRWVATLGASGAAPVERAVTFDVGGFVVQRSGWGTVEPYGDERFALFDCGPLGDGGHGHYDQLHVELMAGGHLLAVDPGRYTYADTPWRHWFKGTAAHNTVTVDGADQTPYRRGKPKGPQSVARLVARRVTDVVDVVEAVVESPCYDAVHTRRLALCEQRYWVVQDRLRAPSTHDYALRWHLPPDVAGLVAVEAGDGEGGDGGCTVVRTPAARYEVHGATDVAIEEGWVSPVYGVKASAPVIVARARGRDVEFVTVVVPAATAVDRALVRAVLA